MTINWKIWAPVGIVILAALVVIGFSQFGIKYQQVPVAEEKPQAPVVEELPETEAEITKPATGNVDDAVNAILAEISNDQALFDDEAKDAELITVDSQAINDFGQSYNENEF